MNILVQCEDVVGTSMAGPGIRYWEISAELAGRHSVTLATPFAPDSDASSFAVVKRPRRPAARYYGGWDAVITQRVLPPLARAKRGYGFRLIVDLYDPIILEGLELHAERPLNEQRRILRRLERELWLALRAGDHFVCASETQRDMWLGALTAAGRITPCAYRVDPTLRRLIDVVPFGIRGQAGQRNGPGLRERFGIDSDDFVILWGGGIWNWLDPLTLIESVAELAATHPDTRLVFMGLEHPNERIPEMAMSARARRLAQDLGLAGKHVFFNEGWVPYHQRHNVLLDADVGVSIHGHHLEAHFAFRTRNLDYLWAGLPVISTRGDVFAEMLERAGAGIIVAPHDRGALAEALRSLRDPGLRARMSEASKSLREHYAWTRAVRPVTAMLDASTEVVRPGSASVVQAYAGWYAAAAIGRLMRASGTGRR